MPPRALLLTTAALITLYPAPPARAQKPVVPPAAPGSIRVATFNASLNRDQPGQLLTDLERGNHPQIQNVAEIIQRARPDILLINEFDYDPEANAPRLFLKNYLAIPQQGAEPIHYDHIFAAPVNTGVPSGADLDGNGQIAATPGSRGYGNDALGFGLFPGQYGMVLFSRFPIDRDSIRTFRELRWSAMPGALLPTRSDGSPWFSPQALAVLRLSSKSHWDIPITLPHATWHILASHPTPPVFDGPEDRNGKRNHDEIRVWADYLSGHPHAAYLVPDGHAQPPAEPPAHFIILGDLNSDPADGGSFPGAIDQLLEHPRVNASLIPRSPGAAEAAQDQAGANLNHKTPPESDTADFSDRDPGNLRVDYVLPARTLIPLAAGVFWPESSHPLARLTRMIPQPATSDHRLVWLDLQSPSP